MKKINYCIIKQNFIYTIIELAKLLGVHKDTVRLWIRQGLPIVEGSKNPILIKGSDAKSFLRNREKNRKCKLKENEFYCLKCKTARIAVPDSIFIEIHDQELSLNNRRAINYGKCSACETEMLRFGSERITQKWINEGWVNEENVKQRYNDDKPTLNTYLSNDKNKISRRTK